MSYSGPKPTYARTYGFGAGEGEKMSGAPNVNYSYGAEGQSGSMITLVPPSAPLVAAPANLPAPSTTHS